MAFGAKVSGILWVHNASNDWQMVAFGYHPPLTTKACPPKRMRQQLISILPVLLKQRTLETTKNSERLESERRKLRLLSVHTSTTSDHKSARSLLKQSGCKIPWNPRSSRDRKSMAGLRRFLMVYLGRRRSSNRCKICLKNLFIWNKQAFKILACIFTT